MALGFLGGFFRFAQGKGCHLVGDQAVVQVHGQALKVLGFSWVLGSLSMA